MSINPDVLRDLNRSNKAFLGVVWPVIKYKCGGGEIIPVEALDDIEIADQLDMLCGIDIWQTIGGDGARGIASRVQFGTKNWETFTVRYRRDSGAKTEYVKRLEAIETGRFIYPYLTSQAYVTGDGRSLIGFGVARTVDIFDTIKQGNFIKRRSDNAEFLAVNFDDVCDCYTGLEEAV